MRLNELIIQQVVHVPEKLEPGVLYISKRFGTCIHLYACGCGEKTVTPQHPERPDLGWELSGNDDNVTLRPSILNKWCNSHYYVTGNRIEWL